MTPLPNATPPPTSEHQMLPTHIKTEPQINTIPSPNLGTTTIGGPPRPGTEYLVLLPTNPRQPGVQSIAGYRPIQVNQFNQQGLIRPIMLPNNAQIIRTQASSSSAVMPNQQTSQSPLTTMANIQNRQMPMTLNTSGANGPRQIYTGPIMSNQIQRTGTMAPRANILQSPGMMRNFAQQSMGIHPMIPSNQGLSIRVPTSMATQQSTIIHHTNTGTPMANTPPQMTPELALDKGKTFFTQLLTNNSIQNKQTALTNLIQALIDGKQSPEQFALNLQRELNSPKPQHQLVPFLNLMLPPLRQSMINGQTTLPGIRAPNQSQQVQVTIARQEVESPVPSTSSDNQSQSPLSSIGPTKKKVLAPGQKTPYAIKKEAREARKREKEASQAGIEKVDAPKDLDIKPKIEKKQQKQKKQLESLSSSTLRDDDDVNDVAAMGGVNLAEESQKIMASGAELVGTQIRSCKDEAFFDTEVLTGKITRITKKFELADPSPEIATLISHATQEILKTMVAKLGILAEHRSENLRFNPSYEVTNDIKGQVKFLAELDRIERRRIEEQERKQMAQIAKSRSKVEDPEQQKLRQKAKDMQRAEQEEVRQREANETARLAIGSRKKLKSSFSPSESSFSQSSAGAGSVAGGGSSLGDPKPLSDFRNDTIRRTRRVNIRDLQTLLELDRTHLDTLIKLTA